MSLKDEAKKELAKLRLKRDALDREIAGLEQYTGEQRSATVGRVSARSVELDITPTVKAIFASNGNSPIKYKDLVQMVAAKHNDAAPAVIKSKMMTLKKRDDTPLTQAGGHGMYRLKTDEQNTT